jgi:hypothetical protein
MSKHTPGPWELTVSGTHCDGVNVQFRIDTESRINIASGQSQEHLGSNFGVFEEECIANGRLIAAAPDLLEALRLAHQFITNGIELGYIRMPDPDFPDPAHQTPSIVRAAIAKAEGQ